MEEWRLERWDLTIFQAIGNPEWHYIITKKGEIKTFVNFVYAQEALLEEYPIENED